MSGGLSFTRARPELHKGTERFSHNWKAGWHRAEVVVTTVTGGSGAAIGGWGAIAGCCSVRAARSGLGEQGSRSGVVWWGL